MSADSSGRKHESVVNAALADLFQKRAGLQAEAESTHSSSGRPDVLVLVDNGPIVVETEYAPARSVNADALARLGMEIQGQVVSVAFAVSVPKDLRAVPQAQLASRLAVATLDWQEWRGDGTSGPRIRGNVDELAQAVRSAEAPVDDLDEAVDQLDEGCPRGRRSAIRLTGDASARGRSVSDGARRRGREHGCARGHQRHDVPRAFGRVRTGHSASQHAPLGRSHRKESFGCQLGRHPSRSTTSQSSAWRGMWWRNSRRN